MTVAYEPWTGTNGAAWNAGRWAQVFGFDVTTDINGNRGRMNVTVAGGYDLWGLTTDVPDAFCASGTVTVHTGVTAQVQFNFDTETTGNGHVLEIAANADVVRLLTAEGYSIAATIDTGALTMATGDVVNWLLEVRGGHAYARVWHDTDVMPAAYTVDAALTYTTGDWQLAVDGTRGGAGTGAIYWDALVVTSAVVVTPDFGAHGPSQQLVYMQPPTLDADRTIIWSHGAFGGNADHVATLETGALWREVAALGYNVVAVTDGVAGHDYESGLDYPSGMAWGSDVGVDALDDATTWALAQWPGAKVGVACHSGGQMISVVWAHGNTSKVAAIYTVEGLAHPDRYATAEPLFELTLSEPYAPDNWDDVKATRDDVALATGSSTLRAIPTAYARAGTPVFSAGADDLDTAWGAQFTIADYTGTDHDTVHVDLVGGVDPADVVAYFDAADWTVPAEITAGGLTSATTQDSATVTAAAGISATGLRSAGTQDEATATGSAALSAAGIASGTSQDSAAVTGAAALTGAGLASGTSQDEATVTASVALTATGLTSSSSQDVAAISTDATIIGAGLSSSTSSDTATLTASAAITATGLSSNTTQDVATLGVAGEATSAGLRSSTNQGTATLSATTAVTSAGLSSGTSQDQAAVAGGAALTSAGLQSSTSQDTATVVVGIVVTSNGLRSAASQDVATLSAATAITSTGLRSHTSQATAHLGFGGVTVLELGPITYTPHAVLGPLTVTPTAELGPLEVIPA